MAKENKDVPLRFRITQAEHQRYVAAAQKLGVESMSIFYRWALDNSATQVLGIPPLPTPKRMPDRRSKPIVVQPRTEPVRLKLGFPEDVILPANVPPPPPAPEPEPVPPSLAALIGVPLYVSDANGHVPTIVAAPFEDDDEP